MINYYITLRVLNVNLDNHDSTFLIIVNFLADLSSCKFIILLISINFLPYESNVKMEISFFRFKKLLDILRISINIIIVSKNMLIIM